MPIKWKFKITFVRKLNFRLRPCLLACWSLPFWDSNLFEIDYSFIFKDADNHFKIIPNLKKMILALLKWFNKIIFCKLNIFFKHN